MPKYMCHMLVNRILSVLFLTLSLIHLHDIIRRLQNSFLKDREPLQFLQVQLVNLTGSPVTRPAVPVVNQQLNREILRILRRFLPREMIPLGKQENFPQLVNRFFGSSFTVTPVILSSSG